MVCHTGENKLLTNVRDVVRYPVGYGTARGPLEVNPGRYCAADKLILTLTHNLNRAREFFGGELKKIIIELLTPVSAVSCWLLAAGPNM